MGASTRRVSVECWGCKCEWKEPRNAYKTHGPSFRESKKYPKGDVKSALEWVILSREILEYLCMLAEMII